jgi:hypothetical protein
MPLTRLMAAVGAVCLARRMTTVNWERLSGEAVEEFVAALLLLRFPRGNRVTPSRGDRGVDIRVPTDSGFDIYQVKRYSRPLTNPQERSIRESWEAFARETLSAIPVNSWTLAMPWDPSNDRLDWLQELTKHAGISTNWMGRTNLDTMAADNPRLVDYYFGDGQRNLQRLITTAFTGTQELTEGHEGQALLDAITTRQLALTESLNEVDPFYRYQVEVHAGDLREIPINSQLSGLEDTTFATFSQINDEYYSVLKLHALCAESQRLRPISTTVQMRARIDSPEHEALERFFSYGAPISVIPAEITESSGPPGTMHTGEGLLSILPVNDEDSQLPDLELRIVGRAGYVTERIDLTNIHFTRGIRDSGIRIAGTDLSGTLGIEILTGITDKPSQLNISRFDIAGKPPWAVLPAVRITAALMNGEQTELAVREGKALLAGWTVTSEELAQNSRDWIGILEAMVEVQRHTFDKIIVPPNLTNADAAGLKIAARLLLGEVVETEWSSVNVVVTNPDTISQYGSEQFTFAVVAPLVVSLGSRTIELDQRVLTHAVSARVAAPLTLEGLAPGDSIKIVPGEQPTVFRRVVPNSLADAV